VAGRVRAAVLLVVALAAAGGSSAAVVTSTLTTTSTTPTAGEKWTWTVTVKDAGGESLRARAKVQVLRAGTVVGCLKGGVMRACSGANAGDTISVHGRRSGVIRWTTESLGVRLTFQVIVTAAGLTQRLRVPVTVKERRRAPSATRAVSAMT
jgi:hypothetical protein